MLGESGFKDVDNIFFCEGNKLGRNFVVYLQYEGWRVSLYSRLSGPQIAD